MRSITLKAALAAMIITIPLSGAFAGQDASGGDGGRGSSAYGDFAQKRWFDSIDSFHQYPTPLGVKHYRSPYNRRNAESTSMGPISEGFAKFLEAH